MSIVHMKLVLVRHWYWTQHLVRVYDGNSQCTSGQLLQHPCDPALSLNQSKLHSTHDPALNQSKLHATHDPALSLNQPKIHLTHDLALSLNQPKLHPTHDLALNLNQSKLHPTHDPALSLNQSKLNLTHDPALSLNQSKLYPTPCVVPYQGLWRMTTDIYIYIYNLYTCVSMHGILPRNNLYMHAAVHAAVGQLYYKLSPSVTPCI